MLKIERIVRHHNTIFFRTTSAGESRQWSLEWRIVLREFPPHAKWIPPHAGTEMSAAERKAPTWTLSLADLEPHITDEDRAALLAISMRLARSGEI